MNLTYLILAFVSLCSARVVLDPSVEGVDITDPNYTPNHKLSERQFPAVKRNLGQQACARDTRRDPTRRNVLTFKSRLESAKCDNDIDYTVRCHTIIPRTDTPLYSLERKCDFSEVCTEVSYTNYLAQPATEVSCVSKDVTKRETKWRTTKTSYNNACGPGLTVITEDKLSVSIGFYQGDNTPVRGNVRLAWLQSNKRNYDMVIQNDVNGIYWTGATVLGEVIQGCFRRESATDAIAAVMDWVNG